MATIVVELPKSEVKTEFSGSSDEDKSFAKSFWQSMQLHPPLESRLVSSDMKQRLKKAPPGEQPVNLAHQPTQEPPQLTAFLMKAHALERADEFEKTQKHAELRSKNLILLEKQRQQRIAKEAISAHRGISKTKKDYFPLPDEEIDDERDNIDEAMKDLDRFDRGMDSD